eukprot:TRINITY_DN12516_c0_g2_i1.p1 TRINITY_DN12516_c0_g2~~TRINITY_DN12516_c0_g2_i1.p1  ORF type:complete len:611 (-),score=100.52 TRINITY_DN12516_c0_g2_i1:259-2091(-)
MASAAADLDPEAFAFLRDACMTIQQYDTKGDAVVTTSVWPKLLEDLGVQADSAAAGFLSDYLDIAGEGLVSYSPMLEALGVNMPGRSPSGNAAANDGGRRKEPQPSTPLESEGFHDSPSPPQQRQQAQRYRDQQSQQQWQREHEQQSVEDGDQQRSQRQQPQASRRQMQMQQGRDLFGRDQTQQNDHTSARGQHLPPAEAHNYGDRENDNRQQLERPGRSSPEQTPESREPPYDNESDCFSSRGKAYGKGMAGDGPPENLEDWESFWGRRASTIQRLFHVWDCNQISHDSFVKQLQDILGNRVDILNSESSFVRLSNKHRSARNMKFAELTSALRQDARLTAGVYGHPPPASTCGSSYALSVYEPSEVGSEAPSHAAGSRSRQSPAFSLGSAGRKHYDMPNTHMQGGSAPLLSNYTSSEVSSVREGGRDGYGGNTRQHADNSSQAGSVRSGYGNADNFSQAGSARGMYASRNSAGSPPYRAGGCGRSGGEFSSINEDAVYSGGCGGSAKGGGGGGDEDDRSPSDRRSLNLDKDFWSRKDARLPPAAANGGDRDRDRDRMDAVSQSDIGSVADSQRDYFTHRGRTGHGNILTWGNDSRDITPERRRGGRQR